MSIEQLKSAASNLPPESQTELLAFLVNLRNERDPDYRRRLRVRLDDPDPSHWLTSEQLEERLQQT